MSQADSAPFLVSKERRIDMPMALLVTLLVATAGFSVALGLTRDQVLRNTASIIVLQVEQKNAREILIRIDENVKQLKEHRIP